MPAVVWSFEGDTKDLEKALAMVQGEALETEKGLAATGKAGTEGFSKIEEAGKKAAKVAGKALVAGLVAATAAAVGLAVAVVGVAKDLDDLSKQARRAGTTAKELDTVRGVFDLAGVSIGQTDNLVKKFRVNLGKAAIGTAAQADALELLGVKASDFNGLPLDKKLGLVAKGMQGVTDENLRATIATDLFGRSGLDILPVLEAGEEAWTAQAAAIKAAGTVNARFAADSEDLIDQIALLKRTLTTLKQEALGPLIPAFSGVIEAVRETMAEFRNSSAIDSFGRDAVDVLLGAVAPAAGVMAAVVVKSFAAIVPATKGTIAILQALRMEFLFATGQWKKAAAVGKEARATWKEAEQGIRDLGATQKDVDDRLASFLERLDALRRNLDDLPGPAEDAAAGVRGVGAAAEEAAEDLSGFTDELAWLYAMANRLDLTEMRDELSFLEDGPALDVEELANRDEMEAEFAAAGSILDTFASEGEDRFRRMMESFEEGFQGFKEVWSEGLGSIVNEAGQLAIEVVGIFDQMALDTMDRRIELAQLTADSLAHIEGKISDATSDEEKARLEVRREHLQKLEAAQRKAALESFRRHKALAIVQAGISTALAVVNAIATAPNIIVGFVMAGLAAALGGVQIGLIASEKPPSFHRGGVLRASDLRGASSNSVPVSAKPGEGFLSTSGVAAAGGPDGVDALNAGRSSALGTTVNLLRVGTRTTEAISHQQLQSRTGRMQQELRGVRPKVGRSMPGRR